MTIEHPTPSAEELDRLLGSIGVLLDAFLLQEPSEEGRPLRYNPLDYAILRMVEVQDGCSGSDIARHLSVARTSVQSSLDRLEKAGFLDKRPPANGGRIRTLHLTTEGQNMRNRIHANDLRNMSLMLSPLTPEERSTAIPLLERIASAITSSV